MFPFSSTSRSSASASPAEAELGYFSAETSALKASPGRTFSVVAYAGASPLAVAVAAADVTLTLVLDELQSALGEDELVVSTRA